MAATIEQIAKELRETNGSGVGDDTEHLEELSSNMAEMTDLMVRDFNMTQRIANTEQERERDLFTTLISTFENKINELIEFMRGDSLRDLEQRREEAMAARAEQRRAAAGPERQVDDKETGILGRMTGGLIADAKALIAPIMSTLGMLVKGGVIALVIGGLFLLFKTIRDNPIFLETVETIKDIWQNSIVPTFNDIRQSIIDFMETPAFDRIIEIMNDVRIAIQNFVSRTLGTLVETLSGVFEGIASIIEGITTFDLSKIVGGVNNIIGSLVSGFVSAVDNVITAVLEMFGVSFKDDATLFEAITMGVSRFFSGLRESVANIFSSVVGWIRNQLGFSEGEMPSILDVITGIYTAPVDLLRSAASWITGKLGFDSISQFLEDLSFADMLRSIVMAPFNLMTKAKDWIVEKLTGTAIGDFASGAADIAKNFMSSILRSILPDASADFGVTDPRRYVRAAIPASVYEFAGIDKGTGEMIVDDESLVDESAESAAREAQVEPASDPSRVAAARTLERSTAERDAARQEREGRGMTDVPQQQQSSSVNISSHTTGILRDRPAAAGIPDNASDAAYDLSMMP